MNIGDIYAENAWYTVGIRHMLAVTLINPDCT